jgi:thiol:disulfide interchange protein
MTRPAWIVIGAFGLAIALWVGVNMSSGNRGQEASPGVSLEEAFTRARAERKCVLVDVYTDWCSWCKKMDEDTYSDSRVINRSAGLACVKVDGDARGDLVARYKVDGYPTVVFLNPDGSEKHRVVGYKGPDDFIKDLDYVLGRGPRPAESGGACAFALLPLALVPAVVLAGRKAKAL